MVVLDQKEEKDHVKDECMSLIKQSLVSIGRCMESLQIQKSMAFSSHPPQTIVESIALTEARSERLYLTFPNDDLNQNELKR